MSEYRYYIYSAMVSVNNNKQFAVNGCGKAINISTFFKELMKNENERWNVTFISEISVGEYSEIKGTF